MIVFWLELFLFLVLLSPWFHSIRWNFPEWEPFRLFRHTQWSRMLSIRQNSKLVNGKWLEIQALRSWHLLAIFANTRFKQLRKQQSWLNFLYSCPHKIFFILSGLMQWCFCSFCIYKWNTFFSVSKHKIYLVWNQVVGT